VVEVRGIPLETLPSLDWMPSRIPVRDALVVFVAEGTAPPPQPYECSESRWYPVQGGHRLAIPYDGQPIGDSAFKLQEKLWDHTTCDRCMQRIAAMTLCYVTESSPYVDLCVDCYEMLVARKVGLLRSSIWRIKRLFGSEEAA
jgi:hypothetical protein